MIKKNLLIPSVSGILMGGSALFLTVFSRIELLVYFFLVLASDRYGLSFYSYNSICSMLRITVDDYIEARNGLMKKDMVAFDGAFFQVLDLPQEPFPGENQKTKPAVKVEGEDWQTRSPLGTTSEIDHDRTSHQ